MYAIEDKAKSAAIHFLKHRGYEVIETNLETPYGTIDIIAEDDGTIVFGVVRVSEEGFPEEELADLRKRFESWMVYYFQSNGNVDCSVRLDVLSFAVLGTDRAIIRHHINALSEVI